MTGPEPDAALRARLAGALLQPSPEQVDRWAAAVDALPEPRPRPRHLAEAGRRSEAGRIPGAGRRRWSEGGRSRTPSGPARIGPATAAGLAAAAAALVAWVGSTPATGTGDRPLTLTRSELRTNLPTGRDFGELADPATRAACLARVGSAGVEPLAGRPVLLDDRPGVLLVLPGERPGRVRVLVVDPGCAGVLADTTSG